MKELERYHFPKGMPGFEECHNFRLVRDGDSPLAQLLSEENEGIGFILVPPEIFFPEYGFEISDEDKSVLEAKQENSESNIEVWVILTNNSDIAKITVNLCAPILLSLPKKLGMQLILNDDRYETRHSLPLEPHNQEGAEK